MLTSKERLKPTKKKRENENFKKAGRMPGNCSNILEKRIQCVDCVAKHVAFIHATRLIEPEPLLKGLN